MYCLHVGKITQKKEAKPQEDDKYNRLDTRDEEGHRLHKNTHVGVRV